MTTAHHQLPGSVRTFGQLLSATRRGARLARLLATAQLHTWGAPSALVDRAEHVVSELAANAVRHGRVPGRDFRLALTLTEGARSTAGRCIALALLVEVTDALGERLPRPDPTPSPSRDSGHGLLLVAHFADAWGTRPFPPGGKTVWAELWTVPGHQCQSSPLRSSVIDTD
ncbi:ATP-binding protein [Streptomyces triticagri]|uniref:ATP-binding protein n=1 Tax=Streptomyces triticagri TaxID=2293568 RepID=A0A372LW71_9ACTN|nr:ATP-binding protein [Streptomyces triticagri]RFU82799.1 ATP-binding protein [Streptomyces triticagri]